MGRWTFSLERRPIMAQRTHWMQNKKNEASRKMDDEHYFTSLIFRKYCQRYVDNLLKQYTLKKGKFRVFIRWNQNDTAYICFPKKQIVCNANSPIFEKIDEREERELAILGSLSHEIAHGLYTDDPYFTIVKEKLEDRLLFPETEEYPITDFSAFFDEDDRFLAAFLKIYHDLWNILEDGYIEQVFIENHTTKQSAPLRYKRKLFFEQSPTFEELLEKEECEADKFRTILGLLLTFSKTGHLKCYKSQASDERVQAVVSVFPFIEEIQQFYSSEEHYYFINEVVASLWGYIKEYIRQYADDIDEEMENMMQQMGMEQEEQQSSGSQMAQPTSSSSHKTTGSSSSTSSANNNQGATQQEDGDDEGNSSSTNSSSEEQDSEETEETSSGAESDSENSDENDDDTSSEGDGDEEIPQLEATSQYKNTETEQFYMNDDGTIEEDDDEEISSSIEKIRKELSKTEIEYGQEVEKEEREEEDVEGLVAFNDGVDHNALHRGRHLTIYRQTEAPSDEEIELYEEIRPLTDEQAIIASNRYRQLVKNSTKEYLQKGRYDGNRMHPSSYVRFDKAYMAKKHLPSTKQKAAVFVLQDESGSMYSGGKLRYSRFANLTIMRFCELMNFDCEVMGHTGYANDVEFFSYKQFGKVDEADYARVMRMDARNCNIDGFALEYAIERLNAVKAEVKILIIIFDGQPYDGIEQYYGSVAHTDLRELKEQATRKHITVLNAAIDSDKEVLKSIYGDGFIDIADMNNLGINMCDEILKYAKF